MDFTFLGKKCVCETQSPPATAIFSKTVTLIFDLDLDK